MGLLHQYPWAKATWLLMSARFVGMNVFYCRLGILLPMKFCSPVDLSRGLSPMDLTHQYPWAKANMAIDVSTICWDEYFSLSFGNNVANGINTSISMG